MKAMNDVNEKLFEYLKDEYRILDEKLKDKNDWINEVLFQTGGYSSLQTLADAYFELLDYAGDNKTELSQNMKDKIEYYKTNKAQKLIQK